MNTIPAVAWRFIGFVSLGIGIVGIAFVIAVLVSQPSASGVILSAIIIGFGFALASLSFFLYRRSRRAEQKAGR